MSRVAATPLETVTVNGMVTGPRNVPAVGASPCSFVNTSNTRLSFLIGGGTVSLIELSTDPGFFDSVGLLGGQFLLNPGDSLRITYAVAPSVVYYPL